MPWWVAALRLTGVGWYVATCVVIGVVGGVLLDRKVMGWGLPLFTLLGVFLGMAVAFWGIYRMVVPLMARWDNKTKGSGKS